MYILFHRQMNLFHETMEKIFFSLADQVDEWALDKTVRRQFLYCLKSKISEIKKVLCYEYPKNKSSNKVWLSISDISDMSDKEKKREYNHCQAISNDAKKQ